MADYLSRHPSPSNGYNKLKAEEPWNNWFTVHEIIVDKPVLVEQNKHPITAEQSERICKTQRCVKQQQVNKQCEQTSKSIIASIDPSASNVAIMESSDSETYNAASSIVFASKPSLKTPMCYSSNQIAFFKRSATTHSPLTLKPTTFHKRILR